ncbi:MAG: L-seryl-tRNA(Sec) selenium transferase [Coriobacteriia bacterium]|nr:L-seryl-tRNA(Sec) selenium transferase [Coriobacteriia bacterium]
MTSVSAQQTGNTHSQQELYRSLPNIDQLMNTPEIEGLLLHGVAKSIVLQAARSVLDGRRAGIAAGTVLLPYEMTVCVMDVLAQTEIALQPSLRPVINATGIVVHTNLGRSVLPPVARAAVAAIVEGYSNLEYDIGAGQRGSRHDHVEALLCELTGAEAAMVVNNNAAAVLLTLAALAGGKSTVVSRGQLVEIGGSFRIPDVMAASGTHMIEVGTTNKTHIDDYRKAITAAQEEESDHLSPSERAGSTVALLFKAHTSNYKISGFSSEVSLEELVQLGQETGIPVAEDLGSGVLVDLAALAKMKGTARSSDAGRPYSLPHEPTVQQSLASGVDVVTFSGDKLLGGPQAGILCGRREIIARLKKHPLARAVRLDKMTLAALEATLALYRDTDQAVAHIPTLRMLLMSADECRELAIDLCVAIRSIFERASHSTDEESVRVIKDAAFAGGGSLPDVELPSYAVAINIKGISPDDLEKRLRCDSTIPIIGRVKDGSYLLAVRCLSGDDIAVVLAELELLLAAPQGTL